ncbi:MAG TPA: corrinoid protein [Dehalococcoidia bacterium]|nr:corrinoid protein [Dehalococcoidia bacterium]HJP27401.1 corrinoid protein [Dehalococcoidia bacterium]|tara:strand:+ start:10795 stop:11433 length:639 start_codon:yes stop_codon:yes gene_type:complete
MPVFDDLSNMIIVGQHIAAAEWAETELEDGVSPEDIIDKGMIPGMDEIGRRWKEQEIHMPEVLIAARAMQACMAVVKPRLKTTSDTSRGSVAIGTVKGDLHDIGKNLVVMMLEGAGYTVHDLGNDVAPEAFVQAAEENNADVVAMSALLTTTVPMMMETIGALEEAEIRTKVKVMIGGAPVSQDLATQIGADGYAPDGATAVDVISVLLSGE